MPKKRTVVESKIKARKKPNKPQSQKNKIKEKREELENFLKTKNHAQSWFNGKQIKLNLNPFSKPEKKSKNLVKFHLDTVKKIDAFLADLEKEPKEQIKEKTVRSSRGLAELREPLKRRTLPSLEAEMDDDIFEIINPRENFFQTKPHGEVMPQFRFVKKLKESPDIVFIKKNFDEHIKEEDFHTRMIGGKDIKGQKQTMGKFHIKIGKDEGEKKTSSYESTKTATNEENNGLTKTKKDLEETKEEIKEKERELEQAKKEAKEKEKELAKQMIEKEQKKKEEKKLKELEMKKARIETKEKEWELKKKAKMEEKKKKLEAKMTLKEEKLKQKMFEKKNKEKLVSEKEKKKEEEKTSSFHRFDTVEKEVIEVNPLLDDDIRKVLIITDNLLEKLPEDVLDDFVKSKDFELYEKVVNKYRIK